MCGIVRRGPRPTFRPTPAGLIGPSWEDLVARVQEIASDASKVNYKDPHIQERLRDRDVDLFDVMEVVRGGDRVDQPRKPHGDWVLMLGRRVDGRLIEVAVALKGDRLALVTTIAKGARR